MNTIPTTAGIYEIRNLVSGRCYIGSSRNLRDRKRQHALELTKGRHCNPRLAAAYAKHGPEAFNFVVLEQVEDLVFLRAREQFWLWRRRPDYNISSDATAALVAPEDAPALASVRSQNAKRLWADPTYRARAVAARKGWSSNKGYRCTPEQIENRRRAGSMSSGTKTPEAMAKRLATEATKRAAGVKRKTWVYSPEEKAKRGARIKALLEARKSAGLPPPATGVRRTPEQRERYRVATTAMWARRKAAKGNV